MSKGEVYAYQVDLTKREEIYRAAERVKQDVGKVWSLFLKKYVHPSFNFIIFGEMSE